MKIHFLANIHLVINLFVLGLSPYLSTWHSADENSYDLSADILVSFLCL